MTFDSFIVTASV